MSAEIRVFINKFDMITIQQWVEAISEFNFNLSFDCKLDIFEDSGFVPMIYNGKSCGFEYDFEKLEDTVFSIEKNQEINDKDTMISFSSSYDLDDLSSSMIASAVIAQKCTGIYWLMNDFELNKNPIEIARKLEQNGLS